MPTKPGSCALPYYGIEFAVLDPVVSCVHHSIYSNLLAAISLPFVSLCATDWVVH